MEQSVITNRSGRLWRSHNRIIDEHYGRLIVSIEFLSWHSNDLNDLHQPHMRMAKFTPKYFSLKPSTSNFRARSNDQSESAIPAAHALMWKHFIRFVKLNGKGRGKFPQRIVGVLLDSRATKARLEPIRWVKICFQSTFCPISSKLFSAFLVWPVVGFMRLPKLVLPKFQCTKNSHTVFYGFLWIDFYEASYGIEYWGEIVGHCGWTGLKSFAYVRHEVAYVKWLV